MGNRNAGLTVEQIQIAIPNIDGQDFALQMGKTALAMNIAEHVAILLTAH